MNIESFEEFDNFVKTLKSSDDNLIDLALSDVNLEWNNGILYSFLDSYCFYENTEFSNRIRRCVLRFGIRLSKVENIVDEVERRIETALMNGKGIVLYPIGKRIPARKCFAMGLWPTFMTEDTYILSLWLDGRDEEVLTYLNHTQQWKLYDDILSWEYLPLELVKRRAIETCNSLWLKLRMPTLIYSSGRPITDMSIFQSPRNIVVSRKEIVSGRITPEDGVWECIPVTRYAKGMSRGLFYEETGCYCGTFYYLEKESTTFLAYSGTVLKAFNKLHAYGLLLKEYTGKDQIFQNHLRKFKRKYPGVYQLLKQHLEGKMSKDLIDVDRNCYIGNKVGLYGAEDDLDQPLCQLAALLGYQIVILENMVGSFQVVTEVLDVRSREDSFRSLIYTI